MMFDRSFIRHRDKGKQQSCGAIHNYFFVKTLDTLREGGVLTFITSQGVMDNPRNEAVRKYLMQNANLVSAIRLPNNLFVSHAGTEVGSDLIVLQKESSKVRMSIAEEGFVHTRENSHGVTTNNYYMDFHRVSHTKGKLGKDPYGKPALEFYHEGGVEGISGDIRRMLLEDLSQNLNMEFYYRHQQARIAPTETVPGQESPGNNPAVHLLDFSSSRQIPTSRSGFSTKGKHKHKGVDPMQLSLFSQLSEVDATQSQDSQSDLQPRKFGRFLEPYHKEGALVMDNNQVGYLKDVYHESNQNDEYRQVAKFHPLQLAPLEREKAMLYVQLRDAYMDLYVFETAKQREHKERRAELNRLYTEAPDSHRIPC